MQVMIVLRLIIKTPMRPMQQFPSKDFLQFSVKLQIFPINGDFYGLYLRMFICYPQESESGGPTFPPLLTDLNISMCIKHVGESLQ